jgi:CCR4-NOT transcription complex subunit 1
LQELAVTHCLNTELQLLSSGPGGEPRQQGGNLSFAAIDMFAKLVILLVKYNVDPSMSKVNLLNKVKKCQRTRTLCGYHHHMGRGEMRKLFLV